jgi:hypothetical protein
VSVHLLTIAFGLANLRIVDMESNGVLGRMAYFRPYTAKADTARDKNKVIKKCLRALDDYVGKICAIESQMLFNPF